MAEDLDQVIRLPRATDPIRDRLEKADPSSLPGGGGSRSARSSSMGSGRGSSASAGRVSQGARGQEGGGGEEVRSRVSAGRVRGGEREGEMGEKSMYEQECLQMVICVINM